MNRNATQSPLSGDIGGIVANPAGRICRLPKWLGLAGALLAATAAAGCGQGSLTPLPELTELPIEMLNPQQKQAAIKEMAELSVKHESQAIDAIEKAR